MPQTVAYYKKSILIHEKSISKCEKDITNHIPDKVSEIQSMFKIKYNKLEPILKKRCSGKFRKDSINTTKANDYTSRLLSNFEGKTSISSASKNTEMNSTAHYPIILENTKTAINKEFKSLCSKGPYFVPTPTKFDWLELQKDFDSFRNRMRARFLFQ